MVTSATLGGWVSSLPVAVSGPAQSGQAQAPVGTTYSFAKVTNSTPWIVTVLGSLGSQTIQPFTFDLIPVIPPNGIIFNYSLPPNGPATLQAGQPSYFQVDWWTGSATPPGSYPGQLTAQAVAAAIAAVVLTSTVQFTAASNVAIAVDTSQTLALDSFVYPTGLSAVNFHAAAVAITQTGSSSGGPISVYLVDENGAALWESTFVVPPGFSGPESTTVPLPLTFGTLNGTCAIVIINDAADITVDVILDQEPNTPGVLIAGQQAGTTLQVEEPSTSSVSETLTLSPSGKFGCLRPGRSRQLVVGHALRRHLLTCLHGRRIAGGATARHEYGRHRGGPSHTVTDDGQLPGVPRGGQHHRAGQLPTCGRGGRGINAQYNREGRHPHDAHRESPSRRRISMIASVGDVFSIAYSLRCDHYRRHRYGLGATRPGPAAPRLSRRAARSDRGET